jgi:hypothetical protein
MVAELLNKLLIEQTKMTKSRLRHSNDNGLAESSVYAHHYGTHSGDSGLLPRALQLVLEEKRVYQWCATGWEILRQLPDVAALRANIAETLLYP